MLATCVTPATCGGAVGMFERRARRRRVEQVECDHAGSWHALSPAMRRAQAPLRSSELSRTAASAGAELAVGRQTGGELARCVRFSGPRTDRFAREPVLPRLRAALARRQGAAPASMSYTCEAQRKCARVASTEASPPRSSPADRPRWLARACRVAC